MALSRPGPIDRLARPLAATVPVVVAVGCWLLLPVTGQNENTDFALFYRPVARAMLSGAGWVPPPGLDLAAYPPGYPLLLAGVLGTADRLGVPETVALDGFALACLATSSLLLFTLVRRLGGAWAGLCASLAFSTYPPLLWLSRQPNSELPFLVVLLSCVLATADCVLARRSGLLRPFLAGALAGGAMLVRPIALILPVALGLSLVLHRVPWRWRLTRIGLLFLGSALAVLPWEIWVAARSGQLVLLSTSGAPSMVDGLTFGVRSKGYRQPVVLPADVEALMHELSGQLGPDAGLFTIARSLAAAGADHPGALIELLAVKAVRSWYGTDSGRHEAALALVQVPYAGLVLLGGWMAWRTGGRIRWVMATGWLITASFWAMSIAVLSIARYTTPAASLLVGLSAATLAVAGRPGPRLPVARADRKAQRA